MLSWSYRRWMINWLDAGQKSYLLCGRGLGGKLQASLQGSRLLSEIDAILLTHIHTGLTIGWMWVNWFPPPHSMLAKLLSGRFLAWSGLSQAIAHWRIFWQSRETVKPYLDAEGAGSFFDQRNRHYHEVTAHPHFGHSIDTIAAIYWWKAGEHQVLGWYCSLCLQVENLESR